MKIKCLLKFFQREHLGRALLWLAEAKLAKLKALRKPERANSRMKVFVACA